MTRCNPHRDGLAYSDQQRSFRSRLMNVKDFLIQCLKNLSDSTSNRAVARAKPLKPPQFRIHPRLSGFRYDVENSTISDHCTASIRQNESWQ